MEESLEDEVPDRGMLAPSHGPVSFMSQMG